MKCYWSYYIRYRSTDIINYLKDFVDDEIYNPVDPLHLQAVRFCFDALLQKDLDSEAECWNSHRLQSSGRDTIPGIPDELSFFPEETGGQNMLQTVNQVDIREMEEFLQDCINNDKTKSNCFID